MIKPFCFDTDEKFLREVVAAMVRAAPLTFHKEVEERVVNAWVARGRPNIHSSVARKREIMAMMGSVLLEH